MNIIASEAHFCKLPKPIECHAASASSYQRRLRTRCSFDTIELVWSKMKALLRMLKARTVDEMVDALKNALDSVNKCDIINWFKHDGYCVNV